MSHVYESHPLLFAPEPEDFGQRPLLPQSLMAADLLSPVQLDPTRQSRARALERRAISAPRCERDREHGAVRRPSLLHRPEQRWAAERIVRAATHLRRLPRQRSQDRHRPPSRPKIHSRRCGGRRDWTMVPRRRPALLLAGALDINRSAVSQVVSSRSVGSQIHPMWRRRSDVEVLAAHEFMFRTRMDHEPYRDLPVADLLASMDDHNDVSMVGRRPAAVTLLVPCFRVRVFRLRQRASTATDRAAARSRFLGPRAVLIAHADSKPTLSLGDGPVGTPSARWSPRE